MQNKIIKERLDELPDKMKQEVLDYIEFLLQKHKNNRNSGPFRFDWEGGLIEFKDQYSSVDLQHKALEWR